ncbi:MAG: helix-hairpin-helix domain-containing protein [Saprospiraceae bacterium]
MKPGNLNKYFNSSFQERVSVFTLIGLLFVSIIIYLYIHWNPPIPDFIIEQSTLEEKHVDSISYTSVSGTIPIGNNHSLFNPNKVTVQELNSFGIPLKTASAWQNYITKGGKFKKPIDVMKIYGMNQTLFNKISPYIQIESTSKEILTSLPDTKTKTVIDPNVANYDELIQAGFPGKMANTLIHYRGSGKTFTSINDLIKIYGMNDSLLHEVSPYVHFKEPVESSSMILSTPVTSVTTSFNFDLNKADTAMLKSLPGLGHVFALRIIAYREKLGGYFSVDQLKEVYGLQDSTISRFRSRLTVTDPYKKIKINQDSLPMIYHPYLSKKDAILIQNYKLQHGEFRTIADLENIKAFNHSYWERILPYLDFSVR